MEAILRNVGIVVAALACIALAGIALVTVTLRIRRSRRSHPSSRGIPPATAVRQSLINDAFAQAPNGVIIVDTCDGLIVEANQQFATVSGYSIEQLIGLHVRTLVPDDDATSCFEVFHSARQGRQALIRLDQRLHHRDGRDIWVSCSARLPVADGAQMAVIHIEDVSQRRIASHRLQWASTHDELTGLHNRAFLADELRRRLEHAPLGTLAVLFLDLDNFKVICDSLGHGVGDELLYNMGQRLNAVMSDKDVISRFGGDEFLLLIDLASAGLDATAVSERLREEVIKPIYVDDNEFIVTASIGAAINDVANTTALELMRDADAAMYRAKARGRNRVELFSHGAYESSTLALRTTTELRNGLQRDEIIPYYQPIVDIATGELTGFEVLARWRHPVRGLLMPAEFLPLAEEVGIVGELGGVMLRKALTQLALWHATRPNFAHLSVSVNVSARQLLDPGFRSLVSETLPRNRG